MGTFLESIKTKLLDVFNAVMNTLESGSEIVGILDGITFDETSQIYQFFSTFRYLLGDVLNLALTTVLILGVSFLLFKLFKVAVNGILSFIPTLNIKLP